MNKQINENTEKLTININHVDLGKIDLLVDNGFYTNRTDFIRNAIRESLSKHGDYVEKLIEKSSSFIGVIKLSNQDLLRYEEKKEKHNIKVIGLLVIDQNIDFELLKKTVSTIKAKGTIIADKKIREYYNI